MHNKTFNKTEPHNGNNNQQRINNNRTAALEGTAALSTRGPKLHINWYQIFAIASIVVKTQKLFSPDGSFLTVTMYHHRETT